MEVDKISERLKEKGIRPTANRILVYRALAEKQMPLTLSGIEATLVTMDKSSIFRVLGLFAEDGVVHTFEDGRGVLNYELCHDEGACRHHDGHIHFYCESCQQSFCMEDIVIPSFELPEGFFPHSVSFVIKGICAECRKKQGKA